MWDVRDMEDVLSKLGLKASQRNSAKSTDRSEHEHVTN